MSTRDRRLTRDAVVVFLLALGLRMGLAIGLPSDDSVFWDEPYLEYARNFSEGRGFWMANPYGKGLPLDRAYAFRPPLFPLLWGCVYKLTGGAYLPIRIGLAVFGAGACALAYIVGLRLCGSMSAALLGGILCAVYPPLIWHSANLMTEPLFIFLSVACLCSAMAFRQTGSWRWLILCALCAGLATLTRSVFVGFAPLIGVWIWWVGQRTARAALRALAFLAMVAAVMAPWIVRNALVLRAFVPTTTDAGHGFYVANNPKALNDPRGFWLPSDWSFVLKPGEMTIGEAEVSHRLMRIAAGYMIRHPSDALRLMARRFAALWRFWPHTEFIAHRFAIAYALAYVPLFPFILIGLWLAHRKGGNSLPDLVLVDSLIIYTTAIHTVFLAMMRYREPLMPFLLILAALAISRAVRVFRSALARRRRSSA